MNPARQVPNASVTRRRQHHPHPRHRRHLYSRCGGRAPSLPTATGNRAVPSCGEPSRKRQLSRIEGDDSARSTNKRAKGPSGGAPLDLLSAGEVLRRLDGATLQALSSSCQSMEPLVDAFAWEPVHRREVGTPFRVVDGLFAPPEEVPPGLSWRRRVERHAAIASRWERGGSKTAITCHGKPIKTVRLLDGGSTRRCATRTGSRSGRSGPWRPAARCSSGKVHSVRLR